MIAIHLFRVRLQISSRENNQAIQSLVCVSIHFKEIERNQICFKDQLTRITS
jgi:hypothetical protein